MNLLDLFPPRLLTRALDDLHALAKAGSRIDDVLDRLERLETQADRLLQTSERFDELGNQILATGERIADLGTRILSTGDQIDSRGEEMLAQATLVLEITERVIAEAREVHVQGARVAEALPTLEQLAQTALPLQGAAERLGRIVDRLPQRRVRDPEPGSES